jgi:hypothetical protein
MGNFIVQDGKQIKFWEDRWLGAATLKVEYPNLYNIARKKKCDSSINFQHNTAKCLFSEKPSDRKFELMA